MTPHKRIEEAASTVYFAKNIAEIHEALKKLHNAAIEDAHQATREFGVLDVLPGIESSDYERGFEKAITLTREKLEEKSI